MLLFDQDLVPQRLNLPDTLTSHQRACGAAPMMLVTTSTPTGRLVA